eukprot:gene10477-7282_t
MFRHLANSLAVTEAKLTPQMRRKAITGLRQRTLTDAFPHLAACWVGPCWGSVLQTPSSLSPLSTKRAVWRCANCLQEFEQVIASFTATGGRCPHCSREQPKAAKTVSKDGTPVFEAAPRMVHQNYRSVLTVNPQWAHLNIQPMLAQKWELVAKMLQGNTSKLLASPKIDGIRCIVGYNAERDELQFFSRGGIILECCHGLVTRLLPLFRADPKLMLDGEIFAPKCNFEELSGLVRRLESKTPPEMREKQANLIEFFAFDIMYASRLKVDAPFSERYQLLKELIPTCGAKRISNYQHDERRKKVIRREFHGAGVADSGNRVFHVPAAAVLPHEINDVLKEGCAQGFEGLMIRRPEFPYEHGKRSFGLLKFKEMHDAEFKVVDVVPGEGKFKNSLGAFVCVTKDGQQFNAPPKVSMPQRQRMWKQRNMYIGKWLTIQYQELSSQDIPRFPIAKCVRGGDDQTQWL